MDAFAGLDWDDGNLAKCQKHGVSIAEIEELFRGSPYFVPDERHSDVEPRMLAIGRTAVGRALFVVVTVRERDGLRLARPVSARFMHRKEVERYEGIWRSEGPEDDDG